MVGVVSDPSTCQIRFLLLADINVAATQAMCLELEMQVLQPMHCFTFDPGDLKYLLRLIQYGEKSWSIKLARGETQQYGNWLKLVISSRGTEFLSQRWNEDRESGEGRIGANLGLGCMGRLSEIKAGLSEQPCKDQ